MRFVKGSLLGHRVQKVIRVDLALLVRAADQDCESMNESFDRFFFFE